MDTRRLLFLIFAMMTPSKCSELTAEPHCEDFDVESFNVLEGEAFYFQPYTLPNANLSNEEFIWYKNGSLIEFITTNENETVHYHGGALFFLHVRTKNSGLYTAQHKPAPGECFSYHVILHVFKQEMGKALLYGKNENSDLNKNIQCPISDTCEILGGTFSWKKDSNLLHGHHEANLWVYNATKRDEGIYTCICSWTHNHKVYNSTGSRLLRLLEQTAHRDPQIISPTVKMLVADEGYGIKLNCSVFCGTNVGLKCSASWQVNGLNSRQTDGYNETMTIVTEEPSKNTIATAILTIEQVSARDFQVKFKCIGKGFYSNASTTLTLKKRESIIPLVIGAVSVVLFCIFIAVLVKYFAIDLALFFRPYFPLRNRNKDARVYDAYVIYQMQSMDKVTEDTLSQFVTNVLPSVLEKKCGYRLFIHGRDDIPGEDRLELVEDRMKQSRRLMVILTPGSGSGSEIIDRRPASPQNSVVGGFDWQVGLHHVLVHRELSVILIQLGDTGPEGYTHLPHGLQHLIRKTAPIRWPQGSRGAATWNSRFWKRVRYLMPATPAKQCPQSDII